MKYQNIVLVIVSCVMFMGITSLADMQTKSNPKIRFVIDSEKKEYQLGEPVKFSFELKNESDETAVILDDFGVGTGNLQVEISQDGKKFVGFNNPSWGIVDTTRHTLIRPGKFAGSSGTVLWCWLKQDVPQFRLKESGNYYFRAGYSAHIDGQKTPVRLESEPIQVTISEPHGEDLEVWNTIKGNGNFAYFIQEGDFLIPDYKREERAKFLVEIEEVISGHPNTFYAESLRQSLNRFRVKEAKRQESLQQLRKQKPQ